MIKSFSQSTYYISQRAFLLILLFIVPFVASASASNIPSAGPVRVEFIIFGLILLGVALLHKQTFLVAVTGLTTEVASVSLSLPGKVSYSPE
jgi:hypothetical protein